MDELTCEQANERPDRTESETHEISPEFVARVDEILTRYGDLWEALADADA